MGWMQMCMRRYYIFMSVIMTEDGHELKFTKIVKIDS